MQISKLRFDWRSEPHDNAIWWLCVEAIVATYYVANSSFTPVVSDGVIVEWW